MSYIIGASGHGKVVLNSLLRQGKSVVAFIDDDPSKKEFLGYPVFQKSVIKQGDELYWGIGNGEVRAKLKIALPNRFEQSIDPSAIVADSVSVGEGTVVLHGAIVQPDCSLGEHCIVNTKASIDHDCMIGDYSHIAPGVTICGNVTIGRNCWIGAGATIIQGVKLGDNVVVGAGATIIDSYNDNLVIIGTPARPLNKNKN